MKGLFRETDFEHPSLLFRLEGTLVRPFLTGPLFYRPFVKELGLSGHEMVLEPGCGSGVLLTYLARALDRGGKAVGVDTSAFWTQRARKRLARVENATVLTGDIRSLELEPGEFDLVTFIHVLHDIHPEKRNDTARALSKLMRRGGRICILEPISPSHGIPLEEIKILLVSAGIEITKAERRGRRAKVTGIKPL